MSGKKLLPSRKEYMNRQFDEIKSDINRYHAGEHYGHSPSDEEAARHYAEKGGAKHFSEKYTYPDRDEASLDKRE